MPHSGEQARREQILPVDLDIGTYTFSSADCMMESIRSAPTFLKVDELTLDDISATLQTLAKKKGITRDLLILVSGLKPSVYHTV